jgi:hypothetical protein
MCIRRLIVHPACNHTDNTHFIPCSFLPSLPPLPSGVPPDPQSCPSLTAGPYEWNPLSKCPSCIRLEAQYRAELLIPGSRANDILVGGNRIYQYPTERGTADQVYRVFQNPDQDGAGPQARPDPARIEEYDVGDGGDREEGGEPWKAMIFRWADGRELKILVVEEGGQGGWAWERTGSDGGKVWGGESW